MSLRSSQSGGKALRVGVTLGMTAAALVGFASTSQAATTPTTTQPALTANPTSGTDAGGNYVTLTAGSAKFVKVNVTATPSNYTVYPVVVFEQGTGTTATCTATEPTASSAPTTAIVNPPIAGTTNGANSTNGYVTVISPTKLSFQVPATLQSVITTSNLSQQYAICVYNKQTNLVGKSLYTIASAPTFTAITPNAGPVTGGQTVTVSGDNFFTGLTASLGGSPLTNITLIDQDTFTAVTGPQIAGSTALTITSSGGSVTTSSAYTYDGALTVSPNTAPTMTSGVTLDIQGSGFSSMTFATATSGNGTKEGSSGTAVTTNPVETASDLTPDGTGARVYLVGGSAYNAAAFAPTTNTITGTSANIDAGTYTGTGSNGTGKTHAEESECENVTVISDSELTCTLDTNQGYVTTMYTDSAGPTTFLTGTGVIEPLYTASTLTGVPAGAYYITVVSNGSITAPTATTLSSGAAFTVSAF